MLQNHDLEDFLRDYWTKKAFVAEVSESDFAALREEFAGLDIRAILERHQGLASVWFADKQGHSQAVDVQPADAVKFFNAGMTVFLPKVRTPTIERWGKELSARLSRYPGKFGASMFLTKQGWRTGIHFDHIENFTVQLRGNKIWKYMENTSVLAPTVNYGIRTERAYEEEMWLYASKSIPGEMPETAPNIELTPGKIIYLPRGYWHEIDAPSESISLLLGFPACPWADYVLAGLKTILMRHPEWRDNVLFPNDDSDSWELGRKNIERLLRHLEGALREVDPGDLLPPPRKLAPAEASKFVFHRNPLCTVGRYGSREGRTEIVASVHQGEFSRRREVNIPTAMLDVLDTIDAAPRFSMADLASRHPHLESGLPKLLAVLVELEIVLPSNHEKRIA